MGTDGTDHFIADIRACVEKVRNHDHPPRDDIYCRNLVAYMGERMGGVLLRLDEARAQAHRWKERCDRLAADIEAEMDYEPGEGD